MDEDNGFCAECGARFGKSRPHHRFCSTECKDEFHNREKRQALRAWREAQRETAA
jgi:hypothetical protein